MFTGIVERTGKVVSFTSAQGSDGELMSSISQLIVDAGGDFAVAPGDSVSINGCCLTVTSNKVKMLAFDISRETLAKTTLGNLAEGDEINLERAMKLGERLGGHMVSGHVDGLGRVEAIRKNPDGWDLVVAVPRNLGRYIIDKGSICLAGVSLTVNAVEDQGEFTLVRVMLIPTTVSLTNFKSLDDGDPINVEVDLIGKYVERLTGRLRSDAPHTSL